MLDDKTIAVVIPAFNEEKQIRSVLESIPGFADRIIVVDDGSTDGTAGIVKDFIREKAGDSPLSMSPQKGDVHKGRIGQADLVARQIQEEQKKRLTSSRVYNEDEENERCILIQHERNTGVGSAVATAYAWCREHAVDCTVKIDGDGQMDTAEIEQLCLPVIREGIDYVKGNRLIHRGAWQVIPRVRFLGNAILSILTKIASGYWGISDTQTAFTAISGRALQGLNLAKIYKKYGYPNDLLVKLNINFCTIREVEIRPVYGVGEESGMKIRRLVFRLSWLLVRLFFKRLWVKYLFKSFHPLFLLYHASLVLLAGSLPFLVKILILAFEGAQANPVTALAFVFLFISGFQSLLFAMWMDIQDNAKLDQ